MHNHLAYLLLVVFFQKDVLGLNLNQSVDVGKLAKLIMPAKHSGRVVGGDVTTNDKLGGYLIALRYTKEFVCGGTLIHELIVLTAAHCFTGRPETNQWTAEGGISKLTDQGVLRQVKSFVMSDQFRDNDMHMDVALIRLDKAMTGKKIGKLALCSTHLKTGAILRVSGWGMLKESGLGPETLLRTVLVPIVNKNKCRKNYQPSGEFIQKKKKKNVNEYLCNVLFFSRHNGQYVMCLGSGQEGCLHFRLGRSSGLSKASLRNCVLWTGMCQSSICRCLHGCGTC